VQQAVLDELGTMLDHYRPSKIDTEVSKVTGAREAGWVEDSAVLVTLQHADDPTATVEVVLADDHAVVSWLAAHEHIDESDGTPERPWTSVTVDAVAGILRGAYAVEETRRLGIWTKSRVLDIEDRERSIATMGPLWGWLFRPFPATVTQRRLDYGVQTSDL
jgi:hypothetical protein